jgi:biopolymer transport protein ExbD
MVDVTFLLLIFFMVTAAFTLQKSIDVPKPESDQASETTVDEEQDEGDRVTVQIDEFNTYHVLTVDWEEEAPSEHELLQHLKTARDGDSTGKIPTQLLVEANEECLHEKVVAALDTGSVTGFEEVLLATVEKD